MSPEKPANLKTVTINAAFLQEIKADHQQLKELLDTLRALAAQPQALANHRRQFIELLGQLRDQLAFHFSLEEAYGYFEDAIETSPRLSMHAIQLRSQHADLFVAIRDLADAAAAAAQGADMATGLAEAAEQFLAFDEALKAHESAELNLILTSLEDDLGVGD